MSRRRLVIAPGRVYIYNYVYIYNVQNEQPRTTSMRTISRYRSPERIPGLAATSE